ncbi:hypothetical protein FE257_008807 [Aspergillus nanangensis]|uniref:Uncharacterized protein n=1 Tax=Aspergillus nanangensis TaxID=2582783 RepID=A0AAD4GU91_ASPNN|nr:hypothetical protein FE257_008807 [Aspergillus nanangensis]
MFSLTNKVSIITGASSGIGLAAAELFLKLGASVYGVDISPVASRLERHERFRFQQLDLRQRSSPPAVVEDCQQAFGKRIDVLLNVAGVMDTFASVDSMDPTVWERVLAINLTVPALLSGQVVNVFKEQPSGGSIVNVASVAGIRGGVSGAAYTASKHGLVGLTKNIAWRFNRERIRCNAICPGGFATGITNSLDMSKIDPAAWETLAPIQALHAPDKTLESMAQPEEAANLMAFLASDAAKEINGAVIPIDRAWSTI